MKYRIQYTFIKSQFTKFDMICEALIEYGSIGAFHTKDIFELNNNCKPDEVISFESQVDTKESSLTFIGARFPNLERLRLNNSSILNVRDIGCTFSNLRFLSLARCGITSLDGISAIANTVEELYLAFNKINDLSDLIGMNSLTVLDLEENSINDLSHIEYLTCCDGLKSLTLIGNPCVQDPDEYRSDVSKMLPNLLYLDEKRLKPLAPEDKINKLAPRKGRIKETTKAKVQVAIESPKNYESNIIEPKDNKFANSSPRADRIVQIHEPETAPSHENHEVQYRIHEPGSRADEPYKDDDEVILTEMLDDIIEDRPPTSRGNYEKSLFKDNMEVPKRNRTSKGIKFRPHVITPCVRRLGRCVSSAKI